MKAHVTCQAGDVLDLQLDNETLSGTLHKIARSLLSQGISADELTMPDRLAADSPTARQRDSPTTGQRIALYGALNKHKVHITEHEVVRSFIVQFPGTDRLPSVGDLDHVVAMLLA